MITLSDLSNAISTSVARRGLSLRSDLHDAGWTFWELRTLNRHRAVGLLSDPRKLDKPQELESEIRFEISRNFHRAWWRGFAYGTVAEVQSAAFSASDLEGLVDIYENRKGVSQWVILVANDGQTAAGVHTWMETYLSPTYRDVLQTLKASGYQITTAVKGKDGLLKFLTGVARAEGVVFPEARGAGPN
jgi:hypothetical protein